MSQIVYCTPPLPPSHHSLSLFNSPQSQPKLLPLIPFFIFIFSIISIINKLYNKNWSHHKNVPILTKPPYPTTSNMPCAHWCYNRHQLIICRTVGSWYALTAAVFQNILELCAYSGESPPNAINLQAVGSLRRLSNAKLLQIRRLEATIRSGCQLCNNA
jgi:hypothetical protein